MADVKISELTALTSPDGAEELVVNDGGTTKKITLNNLFNKSIDVTGTVTADGLKLSASNADSPQILFENSDSVTGDAAISTYDDASGTLMLLGSNLYINSSGNNTRFNTSEQSAGVQINRDGSVKSLTGDVDATAVLRQTIASNGDISFYEDTGTTPKFFWDASAESLGIGTSSPQAGYKIESLDSTSGESTPLVIANRDTTVGTTQSVGLNFGLARDSGAFKAQAGRILVGRDGNTWDGADSKIDSFMSFSNYTNNALTQKMRIDSSGNVGIGQAPETSNKSGDIHGVWGTIGGWSNNIGVSQNAYYNSGWKHKNTAVATQYTAQSGKHVFLVAPSGSADSTVSWTTALTINNDGSLIKGSDSSKSFQITTDGFIKSTTNGTSGDDHITFHNANGQVGKVRTSGSSTSYNTSSDYRLKTDVQPMTGATATFKQLKPVNFEWIADGTRVDGFLAHEIGEVIPAAATGSKDAMKDEEYEVSPATGDVFTAGSEAGFNEVSPAIQASPAYYDIDGVQIKAEVVAVAAVHEAFDAVAEIIHSSDAEQPAELENGQQWRETTAQVMATRSVPDMQGIDQAKVVPLMTATIQELITRIEALEA